MGRLQMFNVRSEAALVHGKKGLEQRDPLVWCVLIGLCFFQLSLVRAFVPSGYLFDEGFYIPAALDLLRGAEVGNREHPMLAKEILAASIALFGFNPLGWRAPSLAMMPLAIFLATRTLWWLSRDRVATLLFGFFLATSCLLNVLGRLGILDAPMLFFLALGAYFFARERRQHSAGIRIAAGLCFGLSLACKWTIAPLLPFVALAWAIDRGLSLRTLTVACVSFGVLPLVIYFLTFAPGFFVENNALQIGEILPLHLAMAAAIAGYEGPSAYSSFWWEWLLNVGPYWPLAAKADGAWRFVILIGNPVSTLLVLPAVAVACWLVVKRRETYLYWPLAFYLVPLFLAATGDRIQFVHHYTLPLVAGFGILSLLLSRIWNSGFRWPAFATAAATMLAFIWIFPALTAAPFPDRTSGYRFAALPGWEFVDWAAWAKVHRAKPKPTWMHLQGCLEEPLEQEC